MPAAPAEKTPPAFAERRRFVLLIAALATIGPFSTDTFLPSIASLAADLGASALQAQQTLSAYMLGFGIMSLWHGAISDAVGRRPVILAGLAVYAAAALVCTVAPSIDVLIGARFVQGLFGGAGSIVSRAIIRDCFDGPRAQRLMATVMLLFAAAPAAAPIIGGQLHHWWGWRSVFAFLLVGSLALLLWVARALPETHPPERRTALAAGALARAYLAVFARAEFLWLACAIAFAFATFFLYVMATPAFILRHLGLTATDFGWFFVPVVAGMMIGATASGRLAGRLSSRRTAHLGFAIMAAGSLANLALQFGVAPGMAPGPLLTAVSIAPLAAGAIGLAMVSPSIQMLLMDLFPASRGVVASVQGFTQVMVGAVVAGIVAPLVDGTAARLAATATALFVAAAACWLVYLARHRRGRH